MLKPPAQHSVAVGCGVVRDWTKRNFFAPRFSATCDFGQDQPSTSWSSHSRELLAGPHGDGAGCSTTFVGAVSGFYDFHMVVMVLIVAYACHL